MSIIHGRALHYVFKVGDRKLTTNFFRDILGMKILRHEEFDKGCEAACNGPYDNRWSKTMVGYGPEDTHFALELTYNYPVKSYRKGNDLIEITIKSREALERAKARSWPILAGNVLEAPGGYNFHILDEPQPHERDPVEKVTLASSNLKASIEYWHKVLGLKVFSEDEKSVVLGFKENEAKLELKQIGEPLDRAEAFGRIAFSCPFDEQPLIDEKVQKAQTTILIPLTSLDTPGKATVRVIILADPDGHEICFVDDEAFRELSKMAPDDEKVLDENIELYEKAPAKYKS